MDHHRRPKVVIVDDQPHFRGCARQLLEARGFDVVAEAHCAASAVAAVERHEPDGMLLDIRLGDDDGFAVCEAVTSIRPDLAVVLASAGDYEHLPERIETAGARGFVRKAHLARADLGQFWPAVTPTLSEPRAPHQG